MQAQRRGCEYAKHTRIVSLNDAVIVNVLPSHVKIDEITYTHRPNGDVLVTDGTDWHLDITHL
jgi:hypothetical protein